MRYKRRGDNSKSIITNKRGFTLVETMVVSLLMTILAGAGFAVLFMFTREQREAAVNLKAQVQSEIVREIISKRAFEANFFLPERKIVNANTTSTGNMLYDEYCDEVYFYRFGTENSPPFAGFRAQPSQQGNTRRVLMEYIPEFDEDGTPIIESSAPKGGFKPVVIGNDTIFLDPDGLRNIGELKKYPFKLNRGRTFRELEVDLTLVTARNADTVKLKLERGVFVCRL